MGDAGTETPEMNLEDLSNAGDRNALVRDLEDLSKERNALINELQDAREEIEHLKQELAVAESQPRVTKNNQNATLRAELAELTAARAQVEKLEMKLAALSKELIEKICDPKLPLGSFELQDLRWQII